MTPEDIGKAYDTITHLWEREEFDRNNGIEAHQHAIRFVENKGKALDVGCGCTGRFIDLLQNECFTVEGVAYFYHGHCSFFYKISITKRWLKT
ncbi:class I SAM-dependent methyltransferase [Methylophaga thalassica]|uniref:hypothetical protein n=1 Tax=Methylophaga aminisulfidivorans TaxID=230105 RepID=UPI0024E1C264|nr:hypothetical protein [Methylophaga aminisulfidivorans]